MNFPSLSAENTLHVGLSDPTFIPKNPTVLPGLATINGPLIVGGTLIDGIMGLHFLRLQLSILFHQPILQEERH